MCWSTSANWTLNCAATAETTGLRRRSAFDIVANDPRLFCGFGSHFFLSPVDAAPVLVLGDRHPAFDADADPLSRGFGGEEFLEDRHMCRYV